MKILLVPLLVLGLAGAALAQVDGWTETNCQAVWSDATPPGAQEGGHFLDLVIDNQYDIWEGALSQTITLPEGFDPTASNSQFLVYAYRPEDEGSTSGAGGDIHLRFSDDGGGSMTRWMNIGNAWTQNWWLYNSFWGTNPTELTVEISISRYVDPETEEPITTGTRHYYVDNLRMNFAGQNIGLVNGTFEVPEPMTMSLLALGSLALIRRRRA